MSHVLQNPVNVLVTFTLEEDYLHRIKVVSSRVKLKDVSALVSAEQKGDSSRKAKLDEILAGTEVIYGLPPKNIIARAPNLKWMHAHLAGIERFLIPEIIASLVVLTSSKGIHGPQVSELAMVMVLMLAKKAQSWFQSQAAKLWQPFIPQMLHSKTLGVMGLGAIGQEVARLGKAFGMRVIALEAKQMVPLEYVDSILSPGLIRQFLAQSDFVVITLPLTPETRGMIGEAELNAMKREAYLVNVARGGIVDEPALLRALREKRIAGAGLDVFGTEPLPSESPFWELPNVIISPHIAGRRGDYNALATDLFCQNLKRYLNGESLLNIIDKQKGF
jgi:phosphoglycerate dehydrogenase-like enzyme